VRYKSNMLQDTTYDHANSLMAIVYFDCMLASH
jgi:hypothetical protein